MRAPPENRRCERSARSESRQQQAAAILHFLAAAIVAFGAIKSSEMVLLRVDSIGEIPILLDETLAAASSIKALAAASTAGKLHRAEPLPPAGSMGPPYALVQFSLSGLNSMKHESSGRKIQRGDLCHIGGTSDLFISLAKNNEHDGWEASMTIVGQVPEPQLTEIVEGSILALPKHNFTHPNYGTVMSMLDKELPCKLVVPPST